jgi:hypothetical protein
MGMRARCKKCGQKFKIAVDPPIDDDTIFGWVTEADPAGQSVLGSTSIFSSSTVGLPSPGRPTLNRWNPPPPPDTPRVRLDVIDDEFGAAFVFPPNRLTDRDFRLSFPHRCVSCAKEDDLEVRLIIWADKLPRQDNFTRRDIEMKAHGRLDQLLRKENNRWFDHLEPMDILPPPFSSPFPYFICKDCQNEGAVTPQVVINEAGESCKLSIANLKIALEFFRNNGGEHAPGFRRLATARQEQKANRWKALPFAVRRKISRWFTPQETERFLGYYADHDFARCESGAAGLVLTDRRLVFHKINDRHEFALSQSGRINIVQKDKGVEVAISQSNGAEARLNSSGGSVNALITRLRSLSVDWDVNYDQQTVDS